MTPECRISIRTKTQILAIKWFYLMMVLFRVQFQKSVYFLRQRERKRTHVGWRWMQWLETFGVRLKTLSTNMFALWWKVCLAVLCWRAESTACWVDTMQCNIFWMIWPCTLRNVRFELRRVTVRLRSGLKPYLEASWVFFGPLHSISRSVKSLTQLFQHGLLRACSQQKTSYSRTGISCASWQEWHQRYNAQPHRFKKTLRSSLNTGRNEAVFLICCNDVLTLIHGVSDVWADVQVTM